MRTQQDILLGALLILLAVWLSPFILVAVVVFGIYKIYKYFKRREVLNEVQALLYSHGVYVLLVFSDNSKWKRYFEDELIPKLDNRVKVVNWSERLKNGWSEDLIEAKILKWWGVGKGVPAAYIFMPDGHVKIINFGPAFSKPKRMLYRSLERELLEIFQKLPQKDTMEKSS